MLRSYLATVTSLVILAGEDAAYNLIFGKRSWSIILTEVQYRPLEKKKGILNAVFNRRECVQPSQAENENHSPYKKGEIIR